MYMKFQDLIEKKNFSLKMISTLILDEADRMLDMGFKPQLDDIVHKHFNLTNLKDKIYYQLLFQMKLKVLVTII